MNQDLFLNLSREFKQDLDARLAGAKQSEDLLPNRDTVAEICRLYLARLFPVFFREGRGGAGTLPSDAKPYLTEIGTLLSEQMCRAVRFERRRCGQAPPTNLTHCAEEQLTAVFDRLPELSRLMASDIDAAFHNDPAATSPEEILLSYPCIEAIAIQRLAHVLYGLDVPFIPRMMTEVAHSRTGIDIHPGASIGESFFIDHGTGVVVGETTTIGHNVTLYHGVTLGAFNPLVKDEQGLLRRGKENKRHPDLEDYVTVYPGATILGGDTRIGHHSVIGGNVWLTHSVAPYSRVTNKDPQLVILKFERRA